MHTLMLICQENAVCISNHILTIRNEIVSIVTNLDGMLIVQAVRSLLQEREVWG